MTTLVASGLAKSYKSRQVVRDLSLIVNPGEVVGLLGPNGAGKTTAFYMIVGLVPCDAGHVRLDDAELTQLTMHKRAQMGLGYLPQEASVFRKLSVEDNVLAILETRDDLDRAARERRRASDASKSSSKSYASRTFARTSECPFRVVSGGVWRSLARLQRSHASCCSTSPSRAWIHCPWWTSSASFESLRREASGC
jgi:ABC-type branched-subunit amino acid transport system ATPase component